MGRRRHTYLRGLAELSDAADIPYNMHILETRSQRIGDTRYGMSLVRYVHAPGVLSERCQVIYERWPTPREILRAATSGGAQALRTPVPTGSLERGNAADIVLMDLGTLPFIRLNDTTRQLVYCEPGRSVQSVIAVALRIPAIRP